MEDIETAITAAQEAVTAYLETSPQRSLTFDVGDYRVTVTNGGEIISIFRR